MSRGVHQRPGGHLLSSKAKHKNQKKNQFPHLMSEVSTRSRVDTSTHPRSLRSPTIFAGFSIYFPKETQKNRKKIASTFQKKRKKIAKKSQLLSKKIANKSQKNRIYFPKKSQKNRK